MDLDMNPNHALIPRPRTIFAIALLCLSMIAAASLSPHTADDPFVRFAAPLAAEPAGTSTNIVLDVSGIGDSPALMQWAGDAGKVCAEWYPIVCRFLATEDWARPKELVLVFRRGLNAPAVTRENRMEFDAQWITDHPDDFGIVIHELTHVIQAYPAATTTPGWLVEGIADYIRLWKYEPEVPRPHIERATAKWTDGYRTTATFLAWACARYDRRLVRVLDKALRNGSYSDAIWTQVTGKGLEELWAEFVRS
ncbi:MAG: hypothetical protein EBY29_10990 [Planctomycetes bacterium]|nr:hypothetical protein [Planctomycetota bacterium]